MQQKPPANQDLDEDQVLWQRVTQNVTPLPHRTRPLPSSSSLKTGTSSQSGTKNIQKPLPAMTSSPTIVKPILPVDLREGDRAGLDSRTQNACSAVTFRLIAVLIFTVIRLLVRK